MVIMLTHIVAESRMVRRVLIGFCNWRAVLDAELSEESLCPLSACRVLLDVAAEGC